MPKASAETVTFPGWVLSMLTCTVKTKLPELSAMTVDCPQLFQHVSYASLNDEYWSRHIISAGRFYWRCCASCTEPTRV
jgi:hypothetical protein